MAEEQKLVTRSSTVLFSQLVDAADPGREATRPTAYQFSNGRAFEQSKTPYGEGNN